MVLEMHNNTKKNKNGKENKGNYLIKPGTQVECAVRIDEEKELIDVRTALIYNAFDSKIIMSQTSPELLPSNVGSIITVTYIYKKENKRRGLNCKVEKIIKDYKLTSSQSVPAVILKGLSDLKDNNLRLAYRVKPPEDYDIKLLGTNNEVFEIVDISATGVKFMHFSEKQFKDNQILKLRLLLHNISYEIKARVIRKDQHTGIRLKELEYVSVQFQEFDKKIQDKLVRAIREMERQIRFKYLEKHSF